MALTEEATSQVGQPETNILNVCGDIFENCLHSYYNLFYMLEDNAIFNVDNELHLIALQFVYKP